MINADGANPNKQIAALKADVAIHVTDYAGVDRTGATDSATGINNALAAARTQGKALYFPAGTYRISSSITLIKNDCVFGESAEKTFIKPVTLDMKCFILTVQEITLKNFSFTVNSDPTMLQRYTAIQLGANNCNIDGIKVFNANKAFYIPASGVYNNQIRNAFAYKVNYGLYCEDGSIFNNNKIEFSGCYGSLYTSYLAGDKGIRLIGSSNEINGGEWAGFDIAFEIVSGRNNKFLSLWSELNQYSFKNTALTTNIVTLSHLTNVHPTGAKQLATENGYGTVGSLKTIGNYGFDLFDRLKSYWIFDTVQADGTYYDYSQNKNPLNVNTLITTADTLTSFGTVKQFTMDNNRSLYASNAIDFTKPLTVCVNASTTKYPNGTTTGVKAWYITKDTNNYVRIILYDTMFGIERRSLGGSTTFVANGTYGALSGDNNLTVVTFDFPNNRILVPDVVAGKMVEYAADFSGFTGTTTNYHVIRHESGQADTAIVTANYAMMWEKTIDIADFFEIAKIKKHTFPLSYVRKLVYQADSTATDVAGLKADFNALLAKLRVKLMHTS